MNISTPPTVAWVSYLNVLFAVLVVACALQDFPTVENSVNKAAAVTGLLAVCDRFPKLCDNIIRPANTKRARAMFGPEGGTVFELYAREAGLASSPAGAVSFAFGFDAGILIVDTKPHIH